MTFPITVPTQGTEVDPDWGADITNAVNDHEERLDELEGEAWTDYTSSLSWTAVSSNPAFGNAVKSAEYRYASRTKKVEVRIRMTMGSTTTYGSGVWFFSLPSGFTAASSERIMGMEGAGWAQDTGTGELGSFVKIESGGTTFRLCTTSVSGSWTSTSPFTWVNTDILTIKFSYTAV